MTPRAQRWRCSASIRVPVFEVQASTMPPRALRQQVSHTRKQTKKGRALVAAASWLVLTYKLFAITTASPSVKKPGTRCVSMKLHDVSGAPCCCCLRLATLQPMA